MMECSLSPNASQRTRFPNLWEFPGGKIEPNETPEACLERELKEEFDVDVTVGKYIGSNIHTYDFGTIELMAFKALWEQGGISNSLTMLKSDGYLPTNSTNLNLHRRTPLS